MSLVVVLISGCGRFGFELLPAPPKQDPALDGGVPDGSADATARDATASDATTADAAPDAGSDGSAATCLALTTDDSTCDGIDDDCDGEVDEDFTGSSVTCGTGACLRSASTTCVDGRVESGCVAGVPGADDATCDGIDEDCDGEFDEDYEPVATTCGVGACAATGVTSCPSGLVVDSCVPAVAAADDVTCDGVDDNCNGEVDEGYVPSTTRCGVGACDGSGTLTCQAGNEVDSCISGGAGSGDATCDGIDDDCDGSADEDYVPTLTSCGIGACAATGMTQCGAGGGLSDSCSPGASGGPDDNTGLPGVDDDCDGQVDEDVVCQMAEVTLSSGQRSLVVEAGCSTANVRLWGGAGGGGQNALSAAGGVGGGGGYAQQSIPVVPGAVLDLYVGEGGPGCGAGGTNPGSSTYNGGAGGTGALIGGETGSPGQGSQAGGAGGVPSSGRTGGNGRSGGGGGGAGAQLVGVTGDAGGGGAASALLLNGQLRLLAGGGGGAGGAASTLVILTAPGNPGGVGCSGAGGQSQGSGGGGGGGGRCVGSQTQQASGRTPFDASALPSGQARGGASGCGAGGAGYAIVTFGG